ncbi:MAG: [FeFe] hydrogenase H-cluster radical SAM maturase HydE, partial [Butyricicoccaceae bacterium]
MKQNIEEIIHILHSSQNASDEELRALIVSEEANEPLAAAADEVRRAHYGTDVYLRGLIEFTNVCKNDCYYCGIRKGNHAVERYSLTKEEILSCCENGYQLGF